MISRPKSRSPIPAPVYHALCALTARSIGVDVGAADRSARAALDVQWTPGTWRAFLRGLHEQNVGGVVQSGLRLGTVDLSWLGAGREQKLRDCCASIAGCNRALTLSCVALAEVVSARAQKRGLVFAVLKGPAHTALLYNGDPGARGLSDLDLLVRRADVPAWRELLSDLPPGAEGEGPRLAVDLFPDDDLWRSRFRLRESGVLSTKRGRWLEIALAGKASLRRCAKGMWARAEEFRSWGSRFPCLSPMDAWKFAVCHLLYRHMAGPLGFWVDLARFEKRLDGGGAEARAAFRADGVSRELSVSRVFLSELGLLPKRRRQERRDTPRIPRAVLSRVRDGCLGFGAQYAFSTWLLPTVGNLAHSALRAATTPRKREFWFSQRELDKTGHELASMRSWHDE